MSVLLDFADTHSMSKASVAGSQSVQLAGRNGIALQWRQRQWRRRRQLQPESSCPSRGAHPVGGDRFRLLLGSDALDEWHAIHAS